MKYELYTGCNKLIMAIKTMVAYPGSPWIYLNLKIFKVTFWFCSWEVNTIFYFILFNNAKNWLCDSVLDEYRCSYTE